MLLCRALVCVATTAVMVAADAVGVEAQVQGAPGGVTIDDDAECPGSGNSAKVTPPFSIEITGLTPFSQTATLFVTDKDASPEVVYGPFTIPAVDGDGRSCVNVLEAPAGTWKIDVVEEGNGFTDSKVFTVEGAPPDTTTTPPTTTPPTTGPPTTPPASTVPPTTPPPTTPPPTSPPTTAPPTTPPPTIFPTTTAGSSSAPTTAPAASTAPQPTAAPPTTHAPGAELPWVTDPPLTEASEAATLLPSSGSNAVVPALGAGAAIALGVLVVALTRRRASA